MVVDFHLFFYECRKNYSDFFDFDICFSSNCAQFHVLERRSLMSPEKYGILKVSKVIKRGL